MFFFSFSLLIVSRFFLPLFISFLSLPPTTTAPFPNLVPLLHWLNSLRRPNRTNPESASTSGQPQQAGAAAASLDSAGSAPNPIPSSSTPLAGSNSASGPAPLSGLGSGLNLGSGSGPSKTFTIDIPLPSFNDVADAFEELRIQHGAAIDGLGPAMDSSDENEADFGFDYPEGEPPADGDADGLAGSMVDEGSGSVVSSHTSSLPLGASALSTPPSLSLGSTCEARTGAPKVQKRTMTSAQWGLKPQFNVESAAALLKTVCCCPLFSFIPRFSTYLLE